MTIDDWEDLEEPEEEHVLEFWALDKSKQPPYRRVERPVWERIDHALNQVYQHGGTVSMRVLKPVDSYINELVMKSLPKQFRIILLTRDEDRKQELLEWWEPEVTPFRGTIRFGDDDWDARTVCSDLAVAQKYFYELYEHGKLSQETLLSLRSPWNPMPK